MITLIPLRISSQIILLKIKQDQELFFALKYFGMKVFL